MSRRQMSASQPCDCGGSGTCENLVSLGICIGVVARVILMAKYYKRWYD
jgi:hypothetical protein